jgi:diguanylate cyclase (GGDEF)-like protein
MSMPARLGVRAWKVVWGTARLVPAASVAAVFFHLAVGRFALGHPGWGEAAGLAGVLLGIVMSAVRLLRRSSLRMVGQLRDQLELGSCLIASAYVLIAFGGALLFPIVYLLMAFLVSFLPSLAGLGLLAIALAFDGAIAFGQRLSSPSIFAAHAIFLVLFAALYHVVLSARLAAARKAEREAVKNRVKEAEERARTFRLVSSGSEAEPGRDDQEKWLLASVKEIEGAVGAGLEIAQTALRTHTCAAFLLTPDDRFLRLYDCRSSSERVQREKFPAGEGILGGVFKRSVPVRMNASSGLRGVNYYQSSGSSIRALLAVPIVEVSGIVRGVLVADRIENEPFTDSDELLLTIISAEVLRAIEIERVMGYIRRARDEKARFFLAIEELNRASKPEQVFEAILQSVRLLARLDFSAVTLVSDEGGKRVHRIVRVTGATARGKTLEGRAFGENNGLVATVVRYGAPLPGREIGALDRQVIFDGQIQVRGLASLKVFPLIAADRVLGTLVVGSRAKSGLDQETLRMMEVIAIQAAQAVLRAQLFEQMEKMAITDGLTGLLNRRAFQMRADHALAQARRYKHKCSFIIADIDHFKSVNDSYGHAIGDFVLKEVARIIREKARDTDIVARYGGEEFAIAMPETDLRGAEVIAERIRMAVMDAVFQSELGPLKLTLSLGIATYPDHAGEKQVVIDLADQCLYCAKRHGRNQSVSVSKLREIKPAFAEATGS